MILDSPFFRNMFLDPRIRDDNEMVKAYCGELALGFWSFWVNAFGF